MEAMEPDHASENIVDEVMDDPVQRKLEESQVLSHYL